ncbi:glycosyltransferase [Streptomyces iconiensis]|uniref:4,4'-diaponeurosporenoate glycosyltransferase n=1 Tax=Streptomyces iconiensis TaxID=1384038 RepID=A0ABT7A607_9ACTN|nr:glycosyltransferase [Streptomyces iconiensis]MDJ1136048.1 glycosyltransferase [Streptomyces iconiensis]
MIRAVAVVVPAHNEERLLPGCLESIRAATAYPALAAVRVHTYVVADCCRDATARLARAYGATVTEPRFRSAGAARAHGTAAALDAFLAPGSGLTAAEVWLAHTDADSRVPRRWLAAQLACAGEGFEAVVGAVTVDDWSGHTPQTAARFRGYYAAHRREPGRLPGTHPHVHGANLAVRADAYLAAGGFPPLTTGEDHALVRALTARGSRLHRTDRDPVHTSARRTCRAPAGFGAFLLRLESQADQADQANRGR